MRPQVYWIEVPMAGRLAILGRPRAGDWLEDEIEGWAAERIDAVVCLLEQYEVDTLDLQREAELCRSAGIEFVSFPIADRGVPTSISAARDLAERVADKVRHGKGVGVHCRAGIGRSAVIVACALVTLGHDADEAFKAIANARGVQVPDTDEQRDWVRGFFGTTA
jgi:protein-tyrosine phosphatase